jgi:hypothetical protein
MSNNQYAVILVHSTSYALKAEKVLEKSGIPCKLIPVPRQISSDCGSCVRIRQEDKARVSQELGAANVEIAGIHDI